MKGQISARKIVKAAADRTESTGVKNWLIADERGVFEQHAKQLLDKVPYCYKREVVISQIALMLSFSALQATINERALR
jgi:hypothetical protein